ncbi:glycosyltransferase family 4 protein [Roseivirga seohaensis]|uniref:glycosyltransferase family 4 protein n=1 Tax=Roseivirga seohaensis TaxID=1914963 RepID=UPI0009E8B64C|nr:glycosyltransferase family 4 protein [Roseivirga seohaensis]
MSIEPKILRITTIPASLRYLLKGQFSFFNQRGFDVQIASADGDDGRYVQENENVKFHQIPLTRTITPLQDLHCIILLYRLIKKERYDIVHSHTPKAGLVAMIAAWMAKVPVRLHTVAGLPLMEATGIKKQILVMVERLTYSFATKVYPNSFSMSDYISREFFSNTTKLKVLANGSSNGIDLNYFSRNDSLLSESLALRCELDISSSSKVGVFVGRLVGDKGINELIEATAEIVEKGSDFHLILVGSFENELDPLKVETYERIRKLSNIHVVGFQPDVRPYLLASDFLVFPSYREGFPNVPLQAGAMGLPSIVSNINGCNEIIVHEQNGLIIPSKSKEALKEAMCRMIKDEELFETLKERSRKSIEDRYDRDLVWEALLSEYRTQLRFHVH